MAVLGIQNFDRMLKRVSMMERACSDKVRDQAMAAAGEVLRRALEAATMPRTTGLVKGPRRKSAWHPAGTAKRSVINVPAKSKEYGVTRRLVGYSKDAFYMLFVEKGHKIVSGGRLARKSYKNESGGRTHSQSGKGRVVGQAAGKHFMRKVFAANIGKAMKAAREVIRAAMRANDSGSKAA